MGNCNACSSEVIEEATKNFTAEDSIGLEETNITENF